METITRNGIVIPSRVTIETIFGCNLHCIMCPIDLPSTRKKGIMKWELFVSIIDSLVPYIEDIKMMDFFCLGEPLLDPHIYDRIKYAKAKGFRNLAISTNADIMDVDKQDKILDSGIDTVILSIDGAKKETHEAIRVGSKFERTVSYCLELIEKRNKGNYKTRFLIRFIRQDKNRDEWDEFLAFWNTKIDRSKRDIMGRYDVHATETIDKEKILKGREWDEAIEKAPCPLPFQVMYILADGTVPLCNEDWLSATHNFGNAKTATPIEIFNSPKFQEIRELHMAGKKTDLKICKDCTLPYSEKTKQII